MGRFLFFCCLVMCTGKWTAQNLDIARHNYYDNPKKIVNINSKCFYLEEWSMSLIGLNANGQVIFTRSLPSFLTNTVQQLIKTKDNCLAVIGINYACDLPDNSNNTNFIAKIDTNGIVKFQTLINVYYGGYANLDKIVDFIQYSDSTYYIVSDSLLYNYSKSGVFISKKNTGLKAIKSIAALNNGRLLVSGKINNTQKNIELTPACTIITQQNFSTQVSKFIQTPTGNIFCLTSANTLSRLDSNLSTLGISTPINSNLKINDFVIRRDTLFATGNNTITNTPFYFISDENFNILYQTPASSYKNVNPVAIALNNNNKMNIIGRSSSITPGKLSFVSYYQFPILGNFLSKKDIGVTAMSVIQASIDVSSVLGSCNLNVTVKNFTADTVKSFYLNHYAVRFICADFSFHKYYNTAIPPNSAITVSTGVFFINDFPFNYTNLNNNNIRYTDICIFTTAPSAATDSQIDNDAFCDSIPVTIVLPTGVRELNLSANLKTFPNPFDNHLIIEADEVIQRIGIYNALGVLVKEKVMEDNVVVLDLPTLSPGIYFLKIETENGTQIKKVIKE